MPERGVIIWRMKRNPEVVMKLYKTENGKELLLLQIPAGAETPYYYTGDGITEANIRIGNESVVADATELKRLVMRGRNSSYDSLCSHITMRTSHSANSENAINPGPETV